MPQRRTPWRTDTRLPNTLTCLAAVTGFGVAEIEIALASGRRAGLVAGLHAGAVVGAWPLELGVSAAPPPARAITTTELSRTSKRRSGNPPAMGFPYLTRAGPASCDRADTMRFFYRERRRIRQRQVRDGRPGRVLA